VTTGLEEWLTGKAAALESSGLTRHLRARPPGAQSPDVPLIDLAGNDYLGLSTHPAVIEAAVDAVRTWGTGSTGSRLVTGTTELHARLEAGLAEHCGQEAALVFSSGYLANLGAVTALTDPETLLVSDAHIHASLVDAARLSRARVSIAAHQDVAEVERLLRERTEPRAVVLTESVFSVLGDAAPLIDLAAVCEAQGAVLLVDEAHGLGVTGAGRGSVAGLGLAHLEHVVVTVTLSKALGSQGGAVLGSAQLKHHLVNRARTFIFDTALAPAAAGAALAALDAIVAEPARVARVETVARRLAEACGVPPVAGAVLSVPMPGPRQAVAAAAACAERGVRVGSFRPPSVPDGVSRLRLTASAALDDAQVDLACAVVAEAAAQS
jgi:8-amino-7-oxononanoate synthase